MSALYPKLLLFSGDAPMMLSVAARRTALLPPKRIRKRITASSSSSSANNAFVVKPRPEVRDSFPADILRACERKSAEFEVRAELDALDPDARLLGIRDVLLKEGCSERSIQFLEQDVENVVKEYRNFFLNSSSERRRESQPPERVVVSLSLLRRTLCTKLHVDYVPLRAMTTYYGRKTEVLDEHSLVNKVIASAARDASMSRVLLPLSDALKSNAKLFEKNLVEEKGESCDILFLKGEMWESGKASVHRSPETANGGWRLVLRVDECDAVNEAEEHQKCLVDDDEECGCEE